MSGVEPQCDQCDREPCHTVPEEDWYAAEAVIEELRGLKP